MEVVILSTNKYNVLVKISAHDVYVIWVYSDLTGDCSFYVRDESDIF